ncbi:hypothetical protein ACWDA7_43855 [Streptomyces sp. NPDC001156]
MFRRPDGVALVQGGDGALVMVEGLPDGDQVGTRDSLLLAALPPRVTLHGGGSLA